MRRLLWKEVRERGIWLALWLVAAVVTSALGWGLPMFVVHGEVSSWILPSLLLALLAGATGYGSELRGQRAGFLASRPIGWQAVLAAKVLIGLIVALAGAALGTLAFRLAMPAQYATVISPASLAVATLGFAGLMAAPYLVGLCCSLPLPTLGGSLLTLMFFVSMVDVAAIVVGVFDRGMPIFLIGGMVVALPVAGVVLARFGLTLDAGRRFLRFILVLAGILGASLVLDLCFPPGARPARHSYYRILISPSGQFGLGDGRDWLLIGEGRRLDANLPTGLQDAFWLDGDRAVLQTSNMTYLTQWRDGQIITRPLPVHVAERPILSPNGRRLLTRDNDSLVVVDLQTMAARTVPPGSPRIGNIRRYWWQSDTAVGYLTPGTGERVVVEETRWTVADARHRH